MTLQAYREAGYSISMLIEQSVVTRAENDVVAAYIVPLTGYMLADEEREQEPYRSAIMALAFLLISQRTIVATRAGAKGKQTEQSYSPSNVELLRQNATTCDMYLQAISSNPCLKVNDICGIYFRLIILVN